MWNYTRFIDSSLHRHYHGATLVQKKISMSGSKSKEDDLTTLSGRVVFALKLKGKSMAWLARKLDVKHQAIQYLCTSKTKKSKFTPEIAANLKLNYEWLATGQGHISSREVPVLCDHELLQNNPDVLALIPNALEYAILDSEHSDVFAYLVTNHEMAPLIPSQSLVFFRAISAINSSSIINNLNVGDIVIARQKSSRKIFVRQFITHQQPALKATNQKTKEALIIDDSVQIIGFAIEYHFKFKSTMEEGSCNEKFI